MSLPERMQGLAESLVSRDDAGYAECWAALHLSYYSLHRVSKACLEENHRGALAEEIISDLVRRRKEFDDRRVDSLDWKYMRRFNLNTHNIIPLVLIRLGRDDLQTTFNKLRLMRNRAAYDPEWRADLQDAREAVRDAGELAGAIGGL